MATKLTEEQVAEMREVRARTHATIGHLICYASDATRVWLGTSNNAYPALLAAMLAYDIALRHLPCLIGMATVRRVLR